MVLDAVLRGLVEDHVPGVRLLVGVALGAEEEARLQPCPSASFGAGEILTIRWVTGFEMSYSAGGTNVITSPTSSSSTGTSSS